jgi:hypothetical protein
LSDSSDPPPAPRPPRRRHFALAALGTLIALAAAWQAMPVALWHARFADQLAREGDATRLHTVTWTALPRPARDWPVLRSGAITIHAPLADVAMSACGRCDGACRLPLDNRGTLAVFDEGLPADYAVVFDRHAPDARDISLWRSVQRNWQTIDALTDRARAQSAPPHSFRFEGRGARGVVTQFDVDGTTRYVVYAYSRDGAPTRLIGVSGLRRERFEGVLGSLQIEPELEQRRSTCSLAPS